MTWEQGTRDKNQGNPSYSLARHLAKNPTALSFTMPHSGKKGLVVLTGKEKDRGELAGMFALFSTAFKHFL